MNLKQIMGWMLIPYAIAAMVTGVLYLDGDFANNPNEDTASIAEFLNTSGNPQTLSVDQPTAGATQNRVSASLGYPTSPVGWMGFLGKSATLTGPIWEGWTAPIRFFLYIGPSLLLGLISLQLLQSASFFLGSIFGRTTP